MGWWGWVVKLVKEVVEQLGLGDAACNSNSRGLEGMISSSHFRLESYISRRLDRGSDRTGGKNIIDNCNIIVSYGTPI